MTCEYDASWCQINELQTERSAAEQSHKDESARTAAELEEFKELVASLRGEVGRLSEQLRLVSAERDRADAMRAASQSGRAVEELQQQLLESLRADVGRHAEQQQIAVAERDEMRKQACAEPALGPMLRVRWIVEVMRC